MDKQEAKSSGDEGRAIVDGRKNKPLRWPDGVYEVIIELNAKNPRRPINDDFLKRVNKKCKSGITVNGINGWWGRHLRKQKAESSGTSASPGVQQEKKGKLKRKAAQLASSEDSEDSGEEESSGEDSDVDFEPKVMKAFEAQAELLVSNEKERLQSELADVKKKLTAAKLGNALADAKQLNKVTLEKLAAANELAKNQSVPSTSNEPIHLNLNPCCLTYPLTHSKR
jgi:hypothetical protein